MLEPHGFWKNVQLVLATFASVCTIATFLILLTSFV